MGTALQATSLEDSLARVKAIRKQQQASSDLQLPLWPDPKRGVPNSFLRTALFSAIQGKDRQFLNEEVLASQDGITVKFTGLQLNQDDLTLWDTLVHLAKGQPLGTVCNFTAHGILTKLGQHTGGDEHRRLHSGLIRLTACVVEIKHQGNTYFGSLISSGAKDDVAEHYSIELNRQLISLYGANQWTSIDWVQRSKLARKPLAQHLHAYYSSHKTPYPVTLAFLQKLSGCRNSHAGSFKRQILSALQELVRIGFLESFEVVGGKVSVKRARAYELAST